MTGKMGKYESLRKRYPDKISLEQFYKICNISKRSASYLVQQGIVPATDTGRRTWRYEILLDDVIIYLRQREQFGSMIPVGAVNKTKKVKQLENEKYRNSKKQIGYDRLKHSLSTLLTDLPDVISISAASKAIGLSTKTINNAIRKGLLKHIEVGREYLLPKSYLVEYMASSAYLSARSSSSEFKEVLERILSNG